MVDFSNRTVYDRRRGAFKEEGMDVVVVKRSVLKGLDGRGVGVRGVSFLRWVTRAGMVMLLRRVSIAMFYASALAERVERPVAYSNEGASYV